MVSCMQNRSNTSSTAREGQAGMSPGIDLEEDALKVPSPGLLHFPNPVGTLRAVLHEALST